MSRHGFLGTGSNSSSSGSNSSSGRKRRAGTATLVTVFEAETGKRHDVELSEGGHEGGGATESLRRKLYSLTGVPAENQILLCGGPPYKPLRSQLPPASVTVTTATGTTTVTTKIYLFDWRTLAPEQQQQQQQQRRHARSPSSQSILSSVGHLSVLPHGGGGSSAAASSSPLVGGGGDGGSSLFSTSSALPGDGGGDAAAASAAAAAAEAEAALVAAEAGEFAGPEEVTLPTEPSASPSPLPPVEGSVLLKTIENYERGSMLALNRGQAYLEASRRRLQGGEACAERMQTMVAALDAAVSNSLDHWEPLQRAYSGLKDRLGEQALRHEGMLQTFEQDVDTLGTIPLHPALVAASGPAQQQPQGGGAVGGGSGGAGGAGGGKTLLDCIPVEREQRLLDSCRTSQRRFRLEGDNVAQKYSAIETGIQEQRGDPVTANDAVQELLERARGLCRDQDAKKEELEANYLESFNLAQRNWTEADNLQDAISRLTQLTIAQEKIVPIMRNNDLHARDIVVEVLRAKARLSGNVRRRLRQVSRLQTDIGKIQKHQELVQMAWGQKEEQFEHLGKVARMPAAYNAFLQEVLRQRRYHQTFEARVIEFCSSMAALRSREVEAREAFLLTHLPNLPPVFVEMAPGLRNMPPTFSPGAVMPLRPGDLPEVYPDAGTKEGGEEVEVEEGTESASKVAGDGSGSGSGGGGVNRAEGEGAAAVEGAAVATQTEESASEAAVAATQTEAAAEAAAVATQTVAAEAAVIGTQTAELEPLSRGEEPESGGGHGDGDGGSGGVTSDGGISSNRTEGGATGGGADDTANNNAAGAGGGGEVANAAVPVPAVEGRNAAEEGTGRRDEGKAPRTDEDEGLGSSAAAAAAALRAENARLAEELAEARARLDKQQLRLNSRAAAEAEAAAVSPHRAAEGEAATAAAAVEPSGAGGGGGERSRSYSDVVGRGRGARAAAPSPAGVDERGGGGGRSRGSGGGGRRGSASSSSSKEATQNQLAAYRAGLSMLVKLTDQQRSAAAAAAVATVDAAVAMVDPPVAPSPVHPEGDSAETPERVTVAAEEEEEEERATGSSSPAAPAASDDQKRRESQSSSPPTATLQAAAVGAGDGESGDGEPSSCAGGPPASGTAGGAVSDGPKVEPSAPEVQEVVAAAGYGQDDEAAAAAEAPPEGVAAAATEESAAATAAAAPPPPPPPPPAASPDEGAAAAAAAVACGEGERQGQGQAEAAAVAGAALEDPTLRSPASPDQKEVPSPGGSPAAVVRAGASAAAAAGPGRAAGAVALRPVDRIRRAADYVATHLRHNHVRVQELVAFEALASVPRISMCSFSVQDIALFLPTMVGAPEGSAGGPVFLAFHVNCPNRYLSEESINNAREALGSSPAYILGRIILVEQHVALEEPNPYNVPPNTVYYVLTAENAG